MIEENNDSKGFLGKAFEASVTVGISVVLFTGLYYKFLEPDDFLETIKLRQFEKDRASQIPQAVKDFAKAKDYVNQGIYVRDNEGTCFKVNISVLKLGQFPEGAVTIECTLETLNIIRQNEEKLKKSGLIPS